MYNISTSILVNGNWKISNKISYSGLAGFLAQCTWIAWVSALFTFSPRCGYIASRFLHHWQNYSNHSQQIAIFYMLIRDVWNQSIFVDIKDNDPVMFVNNRNCDWVWCDGVYLIGSIQPDDIFIFVRGSDLMDHSCWLLSQYWAEQQPMFITIAI